MLQSIAELGCQYADLVLIHWPHAWKAGTEEEDPSVTLQDTWWVESARRRRIKEWSPFQGQ